jgi:hemerythrin-like metal-binding protein
VEAAMPWDPSFTVGHQQIDSQHMVLFRMLDRIADLAKAGDQAYDDYVQIVLDLIKYVIEHFAYERSLMEANAYPRMAEHLARHQALTEQVMAFKERILAGEDASAELGSFVDGWLRHHIAGDDVLLGRYLAERGAAG